MLEEGSHVGVAFLDVNLLKDAAYESSGKLSFSPAIKATALNQVLSLSSAHSPSTHYAWMRAYLSRMRRLSSSLVWYNTCKEHILRKLLRAGIDHSFVDTLARSSICTYPASMTASSKARLPLNHSMWIKLPFHQCWHGEINRCLKLFCADSSISMQMHSIFGHALDVRVAWMLVTPTLTNVISKF